MKEKRSKYFISDRDQTELANFWVYQDTDKSKFIKIGNKKFKEIKDYNDDENNNQQGASDAKVYELFDENEQPTGKQTFVYQGTDNNEKLSPDNPANEFFADDWLENSKLMNDKLNNTKMLEESHKFKKNYETMLNDANTLSEKDFSDKYNEKRKIFRNKTVQNIGGNSQGGAPSKNEAVKGSNAKIITTNSAKLPLSMLDADGKPYYKKIINYTSKFDILSRLQDSFAKPFPSKREDLINGVPTIKGMISSHLGYRRKFNDRDNSYKDLPIHTIKSVKDKELKNGKWVPKTINIKANMGARIPINVWTDESIARSGKGSHIKLDIDHLNSLSELVTGESSQMLGECVTYLNESYQISQVENNQFGERQHNLKEEFKDKIKLDNIEDIQREISSWITKTEIIIQEVSQYLALVRHLLGSLSLEPLAYYLHKLKKHLEEGLQSLHDNIDKDIKAIFKNIDHDFEDGVSEEMMKHLNTVNNNIQQIQQQNDIYGQQIGDIKSIMQHQDATILDGNLNISSSSFHMVYGQMQPSQYLTLKMSILKDHIDKGVERLGQTVQDNYNEYFKPIVEVAKTLIDICHALNMSIKQIKSTLEQADKTLLGKIEFCGISIHSIKEILDNFEKHIGNWITLLHDLLQVSPILSNHLDDIVENMKPFIVNVMFEPTHYDDMFILNSQAQGRLDQMAQQFEVVVNGLNENEGEAIRAMDQSAQLLRDNMTVIKDQLEKLAVY